MGCLTLWIEPIATLSEIAKLIDEALNIPLSDHSTDQFNESPGYEIDWDGGKGAIINLIGIPENYKELQQLGFVYAEEDLKYTLAIICDDLPYRSDDGTLSLPFSTPEELCTFVKNKMDQVGVKLFAKKKCRWVGKGDDCREY
ncbi:hypothetical protein [Parachitinimonas caeni]|uniref:Uncharacterized protein n=1 Tax=Parachitinimonas caeni TaxID=3031301 RepID=A0ABT7DZZ8_9NEIS|nr:hypothetical protein [Parachitinimonas caeni]MDK2125631.1 hypothetical protein [Parachitinimonas caeni]